jgi:hypothetical protein
MEEHKEHRVGIVYMLEMCSIFMTKSDSAYSDYKRLALELATRIGQQCMYGISHDLDLGPTRGFYKSTFMAV